MNQKKVYRILRRQKRTDALDILPGSSSLYEAGIDDSVWILTKKLPAKMSSKYSIPFGSSVAFLSAISAKKTNITVFGG